MLCWNDDDDGDEDDRTIMKEMNLIPFLLKMKRQAEKELAESFLGLSYYANTRSDIWSDSNSCI